jgi:hypothetical protein
MLARQAAGNRVSRAPSVIHRLFDSYNGKEGAFSGEIWEQHLCYMIQLNITRWNKMAHVPQWAATRGTHYCL